MAFDFKSLNNRHKGLPMMNNATKGNLADLVGKTVHITSFGFLAAISDDGEPYDYAVFSIAEDSGHFYFGSQPITEMLHEIPADAANDLKSAPVEIKRGKAVKSGNDYTYAEFVDD